MVSIAELERQLHVLGAQAHSAGDGFRGAESLYKMSGKPLDEMDKTIGAMKDFGNHTKALNELYAQYERVCKVAKQAPKDKWSFGRTSVVLALATCCVFLYNSFKQHSKTNA